MKRLACGLLSAMLLAGTAAALEPISQPIATSGYTYYAIRADGALLAWGDSFHGAVGPADQDPLPWEEANVLLENARYVDAGFAMAAVIDEDGTLWGWGGHAGRTFGEKEPYRLLEDVVSVSVMDATCAALRADGTVWTWGARSGRSLAEHGDDPFYPPTQVLDHAVKLCDDLAVLEDGTLVQLLMDGETAAIRPLLEHVADVRVAYGSDDALLVLALDGSLWWVPCTTAEEEETDFAVYLLGQPEKLLEQELYNDMSSLVVAQGEDGTVLGYGAVQAVLDEGCLNRIAVFPQYRRQGVAQAILEAFLRFGRAHLAFLTLEVRRSNAPAIALYEKLGFDVIPNGTESRHDIIQAITFGKPEGVIAFCQGIQAAAPVDSYVAPEPWDMPGYDAPVIMAAGAFVQGSSIELSADGPIKPPYAVYFQGGLTWYHAKFGIMMSVQYMENEHLLSL